MSSIIVEKIEKYLNEKEESYKGYVVFAKYGREAKTSRMAKQQDLKKGTLLRGLQGVDGGYLVEVTGKNIKKNGSQIEFEFKKIATGKIETSILSNFGIPERTEKEI